MDVGAVAADLVSSRKQLERRQWRWAEAAGVAHDARGYVRDPAANLRQPLVSDAVVELERGSELAAGRSRPARMWSLTSSAALVVNVFDYWRDRDTTPLVAALGLGAGAPRLRFEEPLPTGLEGDPPLVDVALRWPTGRIAAIESKFSEWLVRRPRHKAVFKPKYFPPQGGVWDGAGLPRCQALAADIDAGRERFKLLHAAQLLKHALGLANSGASERSLVYLYYDWPCREALAHRTELDRFVARVSAEVDLQVLTYQALYRALVSGPGVDADYSDYLERRYFSHGGGVSR